MKGEMVLEQELENGKELSPRVEERRGMWRSLSLRGRADEKVETLKEVPLFRGLSKRELELIAGHADLVNVEAGREIIAEGSYSWEFLVIVEGTVRVQKAGKPLARLGPGELLGGLAIVSGGPQVASYVSETPVELLAFHPRSFWFVLDRVPELSRRVLASLLMGWGL